MKYTVGWVKLAEDRLADLWMGSRIAVQITKASDWFDINLAVRPNDIGESRREHFPIVGGVAQC